MQRTLPRWTGLLAFLLVPAAHAQAPASDYPAKPVVIITPFAAGSGPDAVLRAVSDKLSRLWNQRVMVDNRPGGGGFIAIDQARRAAADGYTLLQLDSEHLAALPYLYPSRHFTTLEHFDPVAPLYRNPFLLTVSSESKWTSVKDLINDARARPEQVVYGSWGVGSPAHLGAQQLEAMTGTKMNHAPFREVSQLFTNVATGEIHWSFASIPSSQGVYKTGKIRYLAVAASQRVPQMPDVPTVAEAGGPAGLEVNSFVSILAPKGLPQAVRNKITQDVARINADPDIQVRYDTFAFERLTWTPADILKQAEAKSRIYGDLVKRGNIRLD